MFIAAVTIPLLIILLNEQLATCSLFGNKSTSDLTQTAQLQLVRIVLEAPNMLMALQKEINKTDSPLQSLFYEEAADVLRQHIHQHINKLIQELRRAVLASTPTSFIQLQLMGYFTIEKKLLAFQNYGSNNYFATELIVKVMPWASMFQLFQSILELWVVTFKHTTPVYFYYLKFFCQHLNLHSQHHSEAVQIIKKESIQFQFQYFQKNQKICIIFDWKQFRSQYPNQNFYTIANIVTKGQFPSDPMIKQALLWKIKFYLQDNNQAIIRCLLFAYQNKAFQDQNILEEGCQERTLIQNKAFIPADYRTIFNTIFSFFSIEQITPVTQICILKNIHAILMLQNVEEQPRIIIALSHAIKPFLQLLYKLRTKLTKQVPQHIQSCDNQKQSLDKLFEDVITSAIQIAVTHKICIDKSLFGLGEQIAWKIFSRSCEYKVSDNCIFKCGNQLIDLQYDILEMTHVILAQKTNFVPYLKVLNLYQMKCSLRMQDITNIRRLIVESSIWNLIQPLIIKEITMNKLQAQSITMLTLDILGKICMESPLLIETICATSPTLISVLYQAIEKAKVYTSIEAVRCTIKFLHATNLKENFIQQKIFSKTVSSFINIVFKENRFYKAICPTAIENLCAQLSHMFQNITDSTFYALDGIVDGIFDIAQQFIKLKGLKVIKSQKQLASQYQTYHFKLSTIYKTIEILQKHFYQQSYFSIKPFHTFKHLIHLPLILEDQADLGFFSIFKILNHFFKTAKGKYLKTKKDKDNEENNIQKNQLPSYQTFKDLIQKTNQINYFIVQKALILINILKKSLICSQKISFNIKVLGLVDQQAVKQSIGWNNLIILLECLDDYRIQTNGSIYLANKLFELLPFLLVRSAILQEQYLLDIIPQLQASDQETNLRVRNVRLFIEKALPKQYDSNIFNRLMYTIINSTNSLVVQNEQDNSSGFLFCAQKAIYPLLTEAINLLSGNEEPSLKELFIIKYGLLWCIRGFSTKQVQQIRLNIILYLDYFKDHCIILQFLTKVLKKIELFQEPQDTYDSLEHRVKTIKSVVLKTIIRPHLVQFINMFTIHSDSNLYCYQTFKIIFNNDHPQQSNSIYQEGENIFTKQELTLTRRRNSISQQQIVNKQFQCLKSYLKKYLQFLFQINLQTVPCSFVTEIMYGVVSKTKILFQTENQFENQTLAVKDAWIQLRKQHVKKTFQYFYTHLNHPMHGAAILARMTLSSQPNFKLLQLANYKTFISQMRIAVSNSITEVSWTLFGNRLNLGVKLPKKKKKQFSFNGELKPHLITIINSFAFLSQIIQTLMKNKYYSRGDTIFQPSYIIQLFDFTFNLFDNFELEKYFKKQANSLVLNLFFLLKIFLFYYDQFSGKKNKKKQISCLRLQKQKNKIKNKKSNQKKRIKIHLNTQKNKNKAQQCQQQKESNRRQQKNEKEPTFFTQVVNKFVKRILLLSQKQAYLQNDALQLLINVMTEKTCQNLFYPQITTILFELLNVRLNQKKKYSYDFLLMSIAQKLFLPDHLRINIQMYVKRQFFSSDRIPLKLIFVDSFLQNQFANFSLLQQNQLFDFSYFLSISCLKNNKHIPFNISEMNRLKKNGQIKKYDIMLLPQCESDEINFNNAKIKINNYVPQGSISVFIIQIMKAVVRLTVQEVKYFALNQHISEDQKLIRQQINLPFNLHVLLNCIQMLIRKYFTLMPLITNFNCGPQFYSTLANCQATTNIFQHFIYFRKLNTQQKQRPVISFEEFLIYYLSGLMSQETKNIIFELNINPFIRRDHQLLLPFINVVPQNTLQRLNYQVIFQSLYHSKIKTILLAFKNKKENVIEKPTEQYYYNLLQGVIYFYENNLLKRTILEESEQKQEHIQAKALFYTYIVIPFIIFPIQLLQNNRIKAFQFPHSDSSMSYEKSIQQINKQLEYKKYGRKNVFNQDWPFCLQGNSRNGEQESESSSSQRPDFIIQRDEMFHRDEQNEQQQSVYSNSQHDQSFYSQQSSHLPNLHQNLQKQRKLSYAEMKKILNFDLIDFPDFFKKTIVAQTAVLNNLYTVIAAQREHYFTPFSPNIILINEKNKLEQHTKLYNFLFQRNNFQSQEEFQITNKLIRCCEWVDWQQSYKYLKISDNFPLSQIQLDNLLIRKPLELNVLNRRNGILVNVQRIATTQPELNMNQILQGFGIPQDQFLRMPQEMQQDIVSQYLMDNERDGNIAHNQENIEDDEGNIIISQQNQEHHSGEQQEIIVQIDLQEQENQINVGDRQPPNSPIYQALRSESEDQAQKPCDANQLLLDLSDRYEHQLKTDQIQQLKQKTKFTTDNLYKINQVTLEILLRFLFKFDKREHGQLPFSFYEHLCFVPSISSRLIASLLVLLDKLSWQANQLEKKNRSSETKNINIIKILHFLSHLTRHHAVAESFFSIHDNPINTVMQFMPQSQRFHSAFRILLNFLPKVKKDLHQTQFLIQILSNITNFHFLKMIHEVVKKQEKRKNTADKEQNKMQIEPISLNKIDFLSWDDGIILDQQAVQLLGCALQTVFSKEEIYSLSDIIMRLSINQRNTPLFISYFQRVLHANATLALEQLQSEQRSYLYFSSQKCSTVVRLLHIFHIMVCQFKRYPTSQVRRNALLTEFRSIVQGSSLKAFCQGVMQRLLEGATDDEGDLFNCFFLIYCITVDTSKTQRNQQNNQSAQITKQNIHHQDVILNGFNLTHFLLQCIKQQKIRIAVNVCFKRRVLSANEYFISLLELPIVRVALSIPQLITFQNKRTLFRAQLKRKKPLQEDQVLTFYLNREQIFEQSFNQIMHCTKEQLRNKIKICFNGEEGQDAGGLTREWYELLSRRMFNPDYALFKSGTSGTTYCPSSMSYVNPIHQDYFRFVGRIIGKALRDGFMLDAHFTLSFYKHMLGLPINYLDMEEEDYEYFNSLKWILQNSPIQDYLSLDFTYEFDNFCERQTQQLLPNGKDIRVEESNKHQYVQLVAYAKMKTTIKVQLQRFLQGLHDLMPHRLLKMFDPKQLQVMISGLPTVDIDDLRRHTQLINYSKNDDAIIWFFEILNHFDTPLRTAFLQFVTGSSRVPVDGFAALKFIIHRQYHDGCLPRAHTCFNQLDLPNYSSKQIMYDKLILAITEGKQGFGLL